MSVNTTLAINSNVSPRFSYYKIEETSDFTSYAKRIGVVVANAFIYIANIFYELVFPRKEIELKEDLKPELKEDPKPELKEDPKPKLKKNSKLELGISKSRTWVNKKGKEVCDQGTSCPMVIPNPLKKEMDGLIEATQHLEVASNEYVYSLKAPNPVDAKRIQFSEEDVNLIKTYQFTRVVNDYIEKFKEEHNREPTKEEISAVFTQDKISRIHENTERELKKPEKKEKIEKILNHLKSSEPSSIKKNILVVLGLLVGVAVVYTGDKIGSYIANVGSSSLLSLKSDEENPLAIYLGDTWSLGDTLLVGLHGLAVLSRGWNWGKTALFAAGMFLGKESSVSKKAGYAAGGVFLDYLGPSFVWNGIKKYYDNQEFAVFNESQILLRKYFGIPFVNKVKNCVVSGLSKLNSIRTGKESKEFSSNKEVVERASNISSFATMAYITLTGSGFGVIASLAASMIAGVSMDYMSCKGGRKDLLITPSVVQEALEKASS